MATISIDLTAPHVARAQTAFGRRLNLAGDATQAQIKAELAAFIVAVVKDYEAGESYKSAVAGTAAVTPT